MRKVQIYETLADAYSIDGVTFDEALNNLPVCRLTDAVLYFSQRLEDNHELKQSSRAIRHRILTRIDDILFTTIVK